MSRSSGCDFLLPSHTYHTLSLRPVSLLRVPEDRRSQSRDGLYGYKKDMSTVFLLNRWLTEAKEENKCLHQS
eukprot:scaffold57786_cov66-Cyclotella_meneghiniana.AAC.2